MEVPEVNFRPEKKKSLMTQDAEFVSSNNFVLTERDIAKAREELGETEERRKTCIRELRRKLAGDTGENYRTDGDYLLRYLRVRKFDIDKAYHNIKQAYSLKRKYPEIFSLPKNLESLLDRNIVYYLPYTDEKGNVLFFFDYERWKLQETSVTEILNIATAFCDIISLNPKCQINGIIAIWDVKALNKHHLAAALKTYSVGTLIFILQRLFPWRLKNLIAINTNRFSRVLYNFLRPFVSKKISERVILLGSDLTELHQYVDPVLLPRALGGTLEEDECTVTQNILDNIHYLKYERSFV